MSFCVGPPSSSLRLCSPVPPTAWTCLSVSRDASRLFNSFPNCDLPRHIDPIANGVRALRLLFPRYYGPLVSVARWRAPKLRGFCSRECAADRPRSTFCGSEFAPQTHFQRRFLPMRQLWFRAKRSSNWRRHYLLQFVSSPKKRNICKSPNDFVCMCVLVAPFSCLPIFLPEERKGGLKLGEMAESNGGGRATWELARSERVFFSRLRGV